MNILGLCGSLRKDSSNKKLLKVAGQNLPAGVTLKVLPLGDIPLYNQDYDGDNKPSSVTELRAAIVDADAVLIATPEYNYGIPGVLKNALDWASRPAYRSPLANKPTGIISASISPIGGARSQGQLKQVLLGTLTPIYPAPEFCLTVTIDTFDKNGNLSDEATHELLHRYIGGFVVWLRSLQSRRD